LEAARSGPLASRRILVVDDQASVRDVLGRVLAEAGASVRAAADGDSALRAIKAEVPELILLDLAMPVMDGWQVIKALQTSEGTASVPVILETSSDDLMSFRRAQRLGAAAFISKPFRLNDVIETCRRVLEGDRPLRGRSWAGPEASRVELASLEGEILSRGVVLEMDPRETHLDLVRPLALHLVVRLFVDTFEGSRLARVQWVRATGNRYHHGLAFVAEWELSQAPAKPPGNS
jgi:CheY-like chemotaxis protein